MNRSPLAALKIHALAGRLPARPRSAGTTDNPRLPRWIQRLRLQRNRQQFRVERHRAPRPGAPPEAGSIRTRLL